MILSATLALVRGFVRLAMAAPGADAAHGRTEHPIGSIVTAGVRTDLILCVSGGSAMEIQEALRIMRALADGTNPETGEALRPTLCTRTHLWWVPFTAQCAPWNTSRSASVPGRHRPPTPASPGLEQKINRFARNCTGELTSSRSRRRTIERLDHRAPGEAGKNWAEHAAGYV